MQNKLIGISYPFRRDAGQFPKMDEEAECVKSDLLMLFRTPQRSRVMRPMLGTDAHKYVFEPNVDLLQSFLRSSIISTIRNNEPRVDPIRLDFEVDNTLITATLLYKVKGIQESVTLEYNRV